MCVPYIFEKPNFLLQEYMRALPFIATGVAKFIFRKILKNVHCARPPKLNKDRQNAFFSMVKLELKEWSIKFSYEIGKFY